MTWKPISVLIALDQEEKRIPVSHVVEQDKWTIGNAEIAAPSNNVELI